MDTSIKLPDNYWDRLLSLNDFEDALQYFSAPNVKADVIVTRNEKDFYFSNIKIVSPRLFIENIIDVNPL